MLCARQSLGSPIGSMYQRDPVACSSRQKLGAVLLLTSYSLAFEVLPGVRQELGMPNGTWGRVLIERVQAAQEDGAEHDDHSAGHPSASLVVELFVAERWVVGGVHGEAGWLNLRPLVELDALAAAEPAALQAVPCVSKRGDCSGRPGLPCIITKYVRGARI